MKIFLANTVMIFSVLLAMAADQNPADGAAKTNPPKPVPRVIAIRTNLPLNEISTNLPPNTVSTDCPLKLGGSVLVTVSNLSTLLEDGRAKGKKVVLFVEGNELSDVEPIGIYLEKDTLRFQLKRTAANKAIWTPLLQNPIKPEFRPLLISVGLHGEQPLLVDEAARGAPLRLIGWNTMTLVWAIVFGVLLVIFIVLAIGSDILRSPPDALGRRGAYSMARVQAAFWLFLTTMSFAFIWVVTSDLTTLNGSVLALLGISAGTYVASTMLSKPLSTEDAEAQKKKAEDAEKKAAAVRKEAERTKAATEAAKAEAAKAEEALRTATDADVAAKTAEANAAADKYAEAKKAAEEAAANVPKFKVVEQISTNFHRIPILGQFLEDILTDKDGLSVHRFQMFVWTIVLGIVFVISVVQDLVMPEFSATLLGLMGISSATFIAPKLKADQ